MKYCKNCEQIVDPQKEFNDYLLLFSACSSGNTLLHLLRYEGRKPVLCTAVAIGRKSKKKSGEKAKDCKNRFFQDEAAEHYRRWKVSVGWFSQYYFLEILPSMVNLVFYVLFINSFYLFHCIRVQVW